MRTRPTVARTARRRCFGTSAAAFILLSSCLTVALAQPADQPPPPAPPAQSVPVSPAPFAVGTEPAEDLSPMAMFRHADIVVRSVIVGLMLASIVTWTVLLAKGVGLGVAVRRVRRALHDTETAETLAWLRTRSANGRGPALVMAIAALAELEQSAGAPVAGIKERIASRLRRIEARVARAMTRGTGMLATIGATAPFIGLFGTVWGIMHSFIMISNTHTTNLAVVAPGIAEALLATAAGLVAAIPAVVIYNAFSRATSGYRAHLADLAAAVERLASREIDMDRPRLRTAAE